MVLLSPQAGRGRDALSRQCLDAALFDDVWQIDVRSTTADRPVRCTRHECQVRDLVDLDLVVILHRGLWKDMMSLNCVRPARVAEGQGKAGAPVLRASVLQR